MNFKRISLIKWASLARAVFLKEFLLMEITHKEKESMKERKKEGKEGRKEGGK